MTTLLEIKPIIHDFIQENLDEKFGDKIYWIGERVNEPDYPYCMLTELTENKDKRTSRHYGSLTDDDRRQSITTRYKTAVITVGIYNAFVTNSYDEMDMDEAKEFAYQQIDNLEGAFEDYPINNKFSVQNISPIRALHEPVSGGYMYRFEFDLTIGYNEPTITNKEFGKSIEANLVDTNEADTSIVNGEVVVNGDDYIETNFKVTISGNDNIDIETI